MCEPEVGMKRVFDFGLAFLLLILLMPVLLTVAILVRVILGPKVLFVQKRPGLGGMTFDLYKFRTMSNDTDQFGQPLPDSRRLHPFGTWLRRTSIDELPELWNVLRGQMSFVGPRPLLVEYLKLYNEEQMRRHEVRPGITGWAQVNGRNRVSWDEKFNMDVWYVDNQSFLLDLKILIRTFFQVFSGRDVAAIGSVSTEPFEGNRR
jgi:lipopolysaccharide/colanic/teichoic acid biosynthesis glycosyltransferase